MATRAQAVQWMNAQIGVRNDFDGYYGAQCVDEAQVFNRWLGNPNAFWGNAINYVGANNGGGGRWEWIPNTPDPNRVPLPGDMVVWDWGSVQPYGHIAIAHSNISSNGFTSLDQNWINSSLSWGSAGALVYHSYANVVGWLRYKYWEEDTVRVQNGENWYNRLNLLHIQTLGRPLSREVFNSLVGWDTLNVIELFSDHPEAAIAQKWQDVGKTAVNDKWDQQIYTLQDQNKELQGQINKLKADDAVDNKKVIELQKIVDSNQAVVDGLKKSLAEANLKSEKLSKDLDAEKADNGSFKKIWQGIMELVQNFGKKGS